MYFLKIKKPSRFVLLGFLFFFIIVIFFTISLIDLDQFLPQSFLHEIAAENNFARILHDAKERVAKTLKYQYF